MTKPAFKLKKSKTKTGTQVSAVGNLNVQHASEIKTAFLQLLEDKGDVHLALDEATGFDVAAVQLTYLLKKEIERDGRKVTITLPVNPALRTLLEKSGVTKFL